MKLNRLMSVFALMAMLVTASFIRRQHGHAHVVDVPRTQGQHRHGDPLRRKRQEHSAGLGRFQSARHAGSDLARGGFQRQHLHAGRLQDQRRQEKREVVVPAYVQDIVKVQVYCAWAEVLLGETSFSSPVK